MKLFVCYCCLEGTDSTNEFVIKEFINGIKNYSQGEVDVFFANLLNYNIEFCNGSIKPFETGDTQSPDDMLILEKEILNSDFVILSSPVYGNNVSGATKVFLDRITHWTHLFRLLGKFGAVFSVSSNSGANYTLDYLESIAESLGLSIVAKSGFVTNEQTREVIKNILHTKALLAMSKVKSNEFIISERQEREFQQYKIMFNEGRGFENEISYWTKKNMFESQSLREHLYRSIE
ncbi:Iron-sulfur flavoprotein [Streptococcus gallolyticus]|uniref:Iron-sulfur flavoprotein n=1 Tax=Streptococcus gallolyticus TaxID=315405 RepID=A0A139NB80_9STRE|nr:flavodoxin family protein [Streptococcus gallolyticus]KXT73250.1 Iron-sulfur flavoprotein [Streptococcus gallolyticus]